MIHELSCSSENILNYFECFNSIRDKRIMGFNLQEEEEEEEYISAIPQADASKGVIHPATTHKTPVLHL